VVPQPPYSAYRYRDCKSRPLSCRATFANYFPYAGDKKKLMCCSATPLCAKNAFKGSTVKRCPLGQTLVWEIPDLIPKFHAMIDIGRTMLSYRVEKSKGDHHDGMRRRLLSFFIFFFLY
jgi:hypothetical protein